MTSVFKMCIITLVKTHGHANRAFIYVYSLLCNISHQKGYFNLLGMHREKIFFHVLVINIFGTWRWFVYMFPLHVGTRVGLR